jgi:hypothetical protein
MAAASVPAVWREFVEKAYQIQFAQMPFANRYPPRDQVQGHAFAEHALFAGFFCLNNTLLARN